MDVSWNVTISFNVLFKSKVNNVSVNKWMINIMIGVVWMEGGYVLVLWDSLWYVNILYEISCDC